MEQASEQVITPAVELMDKDETCRFFGGANRPINAATLYRRVQTGPYPKPIKVGDRHRKDYGDLEALARSINERGGLIHPIAVTPTKELIAGERRLKAWQLPVCRFRDQPIPITVIDIDSIIAGEQDENDPALRKNFTPSEAVAIARALRPRLEFAAKERQREGGRST